MAKSNKQEESLEKALKEGLLSPLFKKLVQGRLRKRLKAFEKDPVMRDALKRLDRAVDDFERELEISAELTIDSMKNDKNFPKSKKEMRKHLKDLGFKFPKY